MIKFILVVLIMMPSGEVQTHALTEARFTSKANCYKVGRAIEHVRPEVLSFKCVMQTET
jgi:hypothetical protein